MSASERRKKWTRKIQETNKRCYYKFDIGNICWHMQNNKIRKSRIEQVTKYVDRVEYKTNSGLTYLEDYIFQTKQALINSLYIEFEKWENKEGNK